MAHLFDPLSLRSLTLSNRIVVSPMCQYSSVDGFANDWHFVHLGTRAAGGAALVMAEASAVTADGRISPQDLGIYLDAHVEGLARCVRFIHSQKTLAGTQLAHAGRKASTARPWEGGGKLAPEQGGWEPIGPTAEPFAANYPTPRPLTAPAITSIVDAFRDAAHRALEAGFDVVELHAAHGYLMHEFFSPLVNTRTDDYGGSLANRLRFPLNVIRAVRAAVPRNVAVGLRISGTDWVEGGWDVEQSIAYVRAAQEIGIAYVCVSSGGIRAKVQIPAGPGYQVPLAHEIRQATGAVTRAVGLITDPQQAEQILAAGSADMIALARAFLDDPRWGWHAADALGAKPHFPPPYHLARTEGWRRIRDQIAADT